MPATKGKNLLYRFMLPLAAPSVKGDPLAAVHGRPLADRKGLSSLLRKHHMTGTAGMVSGGKEKALFFGRSFHTSMTADEHTFFRVASVTKMATALLVFILSDRGRLDPDAPVSEYLPGAAGIPELKGVTSRHLLSHTSGLSDPSDLEDMLLHSLPFSSAVKGRRIAEPGLAFRYSNLGFGLLGCVIESVLDLPLGQAYDQFLFGPLGMAAAVEGCRLPEERIMPVVRVFPWRPGNAVTVTKLGRIPLEKPDPLTHFGHSAGSMYTDLPSLEKLLLCIRDRGKPLIRQGFAMLEKRAEYGRLSPTLSYASGLLIINDPSVSAGPVYGHQGFAYGCVDGAFWEENTGRIMIQLNGGCSEARTGRLGCANAGFLRWAFRKELSAW